jgi:hypothetical protein
MKRLFILAIIAGAITASCKKDIHLNLQNASGLLVIEGNVTNMPGPYYVYLSNTITYYDTNVVAPVSGGKIKISDNAGNTDSLTESNPGTYQTHTIVGTVGRTYHLSVNSGGKQYDAYSTMNPPVAIDTLGLLPAIFGNSKDANILFQNSSQSSTVYYNAVMYVDGQRQYKADPVNDQLNIGIIQRVQMRTDSGIVINDTLQAELDVIDQPMYNYWYSLNNATLSSQTAAPANPTSNISNNALGYFSAYAATRSNIIVADSSAAGYHSIQ